MARRCPSRAEPDLPTFPSCVAVRPGFLLSFSLAGLLGVALLAFAVSRILATQIRSAQLTNATARPTCSCVSALGPRLNGCRAAQHYATQNARSGHARRTTDRRHRRSRDLGHALTNSLRDRSSADRNDDRPPAGGGPPSPARRRPWSRPRTVVDGNLGGKQIDVAVPLYGRTRRSPSPWPRSLLPYAPGRTGDLRSDAADRLSSCSAPPCCSTPLLWPLLLRASKAVRTPADPRKQALLRELENGIKHDELLLHYQPTIDLAEGRVSWPSRRCCAGSIPSADCWRRASSCRR